MSCGDQATHLNVSLFPDSKSPATPQKCSSELHNSSGGWNTSEPAGLFPEEWLPPSCSVDSIDAAQFEVEPFIHHYYLRGQPLLIRGGATFEPAVANQYTQQGLLGVAGNEKILLFDIPYADIYAGMTPKTQTLEGYVNYLSNRTLFNQQLLYLFMQVSANGPLNFTKALPQLWQQVLRSVDLGQFQTQFFIGGILMGSNMHHHFAAVNSLVFGKKLWFLQPPAKQVWSNTVIYEHLKQTAGLLSSNRCVQEEGDLMFVPSRWSHGAICLSKTCVGVAHEFHTGKLKWHN